MSIKATKAILLACVLSKEQKRGFSISTKISSVRILHYIKK
ncbi:hypothetical protein [Candidatus Tisiphia endosymbiont of Thecophora atra]